MINKLSSQHEDFDSQLSSLISWESASNNKVNKIVDEIIAEIQNKGDKALLNYTVELDLVKVNSISDLIISKEKLKNHLMIWMIHKKMHSLFLPIELNHTTKNSSKKHGLIKMKMELY